MEDERKHEDRNEEGTKFQDGKEVPRPGVVNPAAENDSAESVEPTEPKA